MRNIQLALRFFNRHWMANLIIIVEIIFLLFWVTTLINRSTYLYDSYNEFTDMGFKHTVYFMGPAAVHDSVSGWPYFEDYHGEFLDQLESFPFVKGIARVNRFSTDHEIIYAIDDITASKINPSISGHWLSERNEVNEIVAYQTDVQIGESVELEIHLFNEFHTRANEMNATTQSAEFSVVGELENLPRNLIEQNRKSNRIVGLAGFFQDMKYLEDQSIYFVSATHPMFDNYPMTTDNCFIYLNESITTGQMDKLTTFLGKYGYWMKGSDMLTVSKNEADDRFQYDLSGLISFAIILIASLVCLTFLNIKRFRNYIALYYLVGCSFIRSITIYMCYLGQLMTLSVAGFYAYYFYVNSTLDNSVELISATYRLHIGTQLMTFGIIAFALTVLSLIPFYLLTRPSQIEMIKNRI